MSVVSYLSAVVGDVFADLGLDPALGEVVPSNRPELAQFQCNGAMAAAKQARRAPRDIASDVVARLEDEAAIAGAEVAGPGFINLSLTDEAFADWVSDMAADHRLGVGTVADPKTVVVDYAGPNVAKAMHVGHLRATIIGDSVARIFDFIGHRVIRDPHFGDWGFQMGLVIAELERRHPGWPYFDSEPPYPAESPVTLEDLQEIYPAASERAQGDEEFAEMAGTATVQLQRRHPGYLALWQHMREVSLEAQRRNFADLGVEFDIWLGESDTADMLAPLVDRAREAGMAEESDGAVIVRVEMPDDKREYPPLLLVNSRGGYLYSTFDVATVWYRADKLEADLVLYVVDARQGDHFLQVFRAAQLCGVAGDMQMEHIGFGTMNGPDGKPFKTREGGVVSLRDLIDLVEDAAAERLKEANIAADYPAEERAAIAHQVGIAALKFGDLRSNRASDYVFDLERFSSFEGKTGPYLQYAAVRIRSLLRKAQQAGFEPGKVISPTVEAERSLMLELLRVPEVVTRAADLRAPNHVAEYAFELAGHFNRFYESCHMLSEPDPNRRAGWLALSQLTLTTLTRVLDLLGIEVPERM